MIVSHRVEVVLESKGPWRYFRRRLEVYCREMFPNQSADWRVQEVLMVLRRVRVVDADGQSRKPVV